MAPAMDVRPITPPPSLQRNATIRSPVTPIGNRLGNNVHVTPEHIKRMEVQRLKAKATREESTRNQEPDRAPKRQRMDASGRMERGTIVQSSYIEYNFSNMKDSKAGFMVEEAAATKEDQDRLRKIEESRKYNPPLSMNKDENAKCFECGREELDFQFLAVFKSRVCFKCKQDHPDKYSLLTKTECKEDYLLTDPELRDVEIMPHLLKPNPHNTTYSSMMLYLRYQVEEFAYKKWSGPEGLDAEYERRQAEKKVKKDKKFESKLRELRKKTRVAKFSSKAARRLEARHEHEFGQEVTDQETGMSIRTCNICGLESEEILM